MMEWRYGSMYSYLLTELSPSWEAANCAAIQKIPSNFKEPEGSSRCLQEPSTGPCPGSVLILSTHVHLGLPSGLFSSGFPTNILYAFLVSPIRATCPAHLILLDLIILIMFGELSLLLWRRYSYGLWVGQPGFGSRHDKIFLFSIASKSALGPTQPPIEWVLGTISPGGKAARACNWPLASI
jgi:hypothetical protein